MRIGILGSGLMGGELGTIFARAGHEVVFSYARSNDKLKQALEVNQITTLRRNSMCNQSDDHKEEQSPLCQADVKS